MADPFEVLREPVTPVDPDPDFAKLPPFSFNESHFLAQGLHLGAEVRF